jgi:hypothetical protein
MDKGIFVLRPFVKVLTAPFLVFEVDTLINPRRIENFQGRIIFWMGASHQPDVNQPTKPRRR